MSSTSHRPWAALPRALIAAGCPDGWDVVYMRLDESRGLKLFDREQRARQAYYGNALLANADWAPAVLSELKTLDLGGERYYYFVVEHCPLLFEDIAAAGVDEYGSTYYDDVTDYTFGLATAIRRELGYHVLDLYPQNVGLMPDGRVVVVDAGGVYMGGSGN